MTQKKNEERKDDLFFKVSIENIHNGLIGEVGLREFAVLAAIASFADDKGIAFPSQETLAKLCDVSERTIIRLINNLCEYRTADGKAILIRKTERKDVKKSMNIYTVTTSAGMAFGSRKVVTNMSVRKDEEIEGCEVSSGGSDKTGKQVVTKLVRGHDKSVTLTKAINKSHLTKSIIEQDGESAASIVEKNKDSSKNNKDNNYIVEGKESKLPKVNHSDIVEIPERKRITSSIVANGRNRKEDSGTGTGAAVDKAKDNDRNDERPLSMSEILRIRKEEYRKAAEREVAAKIEAERKKSSEWLQAIAHRNAQGHATTSQEESLTNRSSVPQKPQNERIQAAQDDDNFADFVAELLG